MPFAEFQPSAAGAQLNDQILRNAEFGASLMERAQRGRLLERELQQDATRFAADLATSNLRREEAQIALHQQRLDLQARERATQLSTDLRAGFDPAQFSASVESIRDLIDPDAQIGAVSALRSTFARYRAVPELARLMDDQFGALEPVIAANQESRLHERITANRYARTPEEAAQKFPGYRITPTVIPDGTTESGGRKVRLIYLAEDEVDPRLEAEAFQLLETASAWGDPAKLEALDHDPTVAAVLRVPGSKFADAYIGAVIAARGFAPARVRVATETTASSPPVAPTAVAAVGNADPISTIVTNPTAPTPSHSDLSPSASPADEQTESAPLADPEPIVGSYLIADDDDPRRAVAGGTFRVGGGTDLAPGAAGDGASRASSSGGVPPVYVTPPEPIGAQWVVRKEYPWLFEEALKKGYTLTGELRSSDVAFEQPVARGEGGKLLRSHLPASTTLPEGAPGIVGKQIWINVNDRLMKVKIVTNPEIIADALANADISPERIDMYRAAQARGEGEVLLTEGKVRPGAMQKTMPLTLKGGTQAVLVRTAQGLTVLAVIGTTARMGTSLGESLGGGSAAPVAAQAVREVGGWGGAIAGAKVFGAAGTLAGLETGPGALLVGLIGAIVGGLGGYYGADWVADHIHAEEAKQE